MRILPSFLDKHSEKKGFAMLYAVLVSSLLLSIGISIFNLTVKELVLSSSGRESQFAFYAADTGAECALYWDFRGNGQIFATSTDGRTPIPAAPDCIGTPITISNIAYPAGGGAETTISLTIPSGTAVPYCAVVKVKKYVNNFLETTRINSYGYNTCDSTDPGRIERGLRICYGTECSNPIMN
jgi:hypothetical protein